MSSPKSTTYGLLQSDERYKKLERAIKLIMNHRSEIGFSNVSSINGDQLDTSAEVSQCSRLGSEVVASSSNMKNILSHKAKISNSQSTTSNIDKNAIEKALMPPPRAKGVLAHSSSKNSLASVNNTPCPMQIDSGIGQSYEILSPGAISSIKTSTTTQNNKETVQHETPDRIFSKWRVMLNAQGQLLIRGTLQCGKVARSKPVIRRHSVICVQSIFNHIYHLEGNIYDDKHELPDYIRGKFFNGFPDDWENVCQLWRNYVAKSYKDNFRWPMPIADSDDDLISEITDVSVGFKLEKQSRSCDDTITTRNMSKGVNSIKSPSTQKLTDTPKTPSINKESIKPVRELKSMDIDLQKVNNNLTEAVEQPSHASSCQSDKNVPSLKDILQEDKLKIIFDTLTSKNCSIEYIDKLIQMFDCYKYLMSYKPDETNDEKSKTGPTISESEKNLQQENFNAVESTSAKIETPVPREIVKESTISQSTFTIPNLSSMKNHAISSRRSSRKKLTSSELSESDLDSQRPCRSVRRVLRTREERSARHKPFLRESSLTEQLESRRRRLNYDSDDNDLKKPKLSPAAALPRSERDGSVIKPPPATSRRSQTPKNLEYCPQSPAYRRDRKSELSRGLQRGSSVSTIKGFLATYDSSVSITEDERNAEVKTIIRQSPRLASKEQHTPLQAPNFYDSSVSITEDESREPNSGFQSDTQRRILQEANARCFQQLKRPLSLNRMSGLQSNHQISSNMHVKSENIIDEKLSEQPQEQKKMFSEKFTLNHDKENTSNQFENQNINVEPIQSRIIPRQITKPVVTSVEIVNIPLSKQIFVESRAKSAEILALESQSEATQERLKSFESTKTPNKSKVSPTTVIKSDVKTRAKKSPVTMEPKETAENKAIFGSECNPKKLTTWIPRVLGKSEQSLVFEGKLLNEVGHIINRKFTTDIILRRIKPTIVETVSHEFYQLIGEMCDPKHIVPKELQKQCFNKCPDRIGWFCKKWNELESQNSTVNSTIGMENVTRSSRGRRIVPPLCYWEGERVTLKGNQSIYSPGNSFDAMNSSSGVLRKENSEISTTHRDSLTKKSGITSTSNSKPVKDTSIQENSIKSSLEKDQNPETQNKRQSQRFNIKRQLEKYYDSSSDLDEIPSTMSKRQKDTLRNADGEKSETKKKLSNKRETRHSGIVAKYTSVSVKNDFSSEAE